MNQKEIAKKIKELRDQQSKIKLLIHQKKVDKKKKIQAIRRKKEAMLKAERRQLSAQITEQHKIYLKEMQVDKDAIRDLDKQIEALLNPNEEVKAA